MAAKKKEPMALAKRAAQLLEDPKDAGKKDVKRLARFVLDHQRSMAPLTKVAGTKSKKSKDTKKKAGKKT